MEGKPFDVTWSSTQEERYGEPGRAALKTVIEFERDREGFQVLEVFGGCFIGDTGELPADNGYMVIATRDEVDELVAKLREVTGREVLFKEVA